MNAGPVENHRSREEGVLVYPVYSRRSRGLSAGINLFPDRKRCSFNCPYCEVFPFKADMVFSVEALERALEKTLAWAMEGGIPVRDVCFSGNGEPTMSPRFPAALETAARIRDKLAPGAALVLITNGTGLLDGAVFETLRKAAAGPPLLDIWLKLDAGTEGWYQRMARSSLPFSELTGKIREFVRLAPVTIQTMLCAVEGKAPPPEEAAAWEKLVVELAGSGAAPDVPAASGGAGVRKVQLYGKARPAPEDPLAEALEDSYLEERAASLRAALTAGGVEISVEVFP
ncbi:MAG: radical SAM protein [Treponema sp.]|nr:radical SAM protein [Treponema sp.]